MPFTLDDYVIKSLAAEDQAALHDLLVMCTDYFVLVNGKPPGPVSAVSLLESRPEGITIEQKRDIVMYDLDGRLIGLIDAVEGYPDEGAWWLGLMLIDPEYRGKGLGHKLYQAFENWILEQGAVGVCLGVVEENDKALAFWGSLGFQEHDRQPSRQFGDKTHAIITMVRYLPKA